MRGDRRRLLRGAAGLALAGLAGCGFRPVHAPGGAAAGDPGVESDLAAIRVGVIPERFGQLMRRALQQRLGTSGVADPRWELQVAPAIATDGIGVLRDGTSTRVRYLATANWTLTQLSPREVTANGFERTIDAFNIQPNQYFAADASRETTERRLAEALADEVVLRLAMRLRNLREGQAPRLIEPVPTAPTLPDPAAPLGIGPDGGGVGSPGVGGGLGGGIGPLSVPR